VGAPSFVVDASVVVRWLVDGPISAECRAFLDHCGARDAHLLAPSCLYSEVANALYRLCLASPAQGSILSTGAERLLRSVPDDEIALVDYVRRSPSGEIALVPQWEQLPDGSVQDYRIDIYARGMTWSYPSRRGSLFDMSYAALAEQAGTTMWTIDERFYNGARAQGLAHMMYPGRDPRPSWSGVGDAVVSAGLGHIALSVVGHAPFVYADAISPAFAPCSSERVGNSTCSRIVSPSALATS